MSDEPKKVPLVIYEDEQLMLGRKIIGEATLNEDRIEAVITDPEVMKKLSAGLTDHLSVGDDPIKKNVFDKEGEDGVPPIHP